VEIPLRALRRADVVDWFSTDSRFHATGGMPQVWPENPALFPIGAHVYGVAVKVVVYHGSYGCDTGCCGHFIELQDDQGKTVDTDFDFVHPWAKDDDPLEFAKELVVASFGEEHVADLDWENCRISRD